MGFKAYLIFLGTLAVSVHFSHGCEMDGVANWLVPQQLNILDVFRGEIFGSNTNSITGINQVNVNQVLNKGPYFDFVAADSRFTIRTNDAYIEYEEHEIETSISFTVLFNCAGGTTRSMVFVIDITDTNNNDPIFGPTTDLEFTVVPPLPPGFQITGCWNDIYARDIDLTTQRVDFEIYDSPYFEIEYDKDSSTVPKQFKATLKTTTFIRSISEPIEFRISATDVDLTNDPRRTTYTTVRIKSDGEFELPEELTFSQPFYRATYTEDHQVVLEETISLRQGYHAEVQFSLGPDYTEYFTLVEDSNKISIRVINQLSAELLTLQQLILVVNAERNHTSGASATVILQLPEEEALDFQQASYEGNITDNVLQLSELLLAQGYEGDPVTVDIISEHSAFFSSTTQQNRITLAMTPLPSNVIEQNSFLNLQIVASTNRTSATTIVTLEIVKDDGVTPVFQRTLYEGTYDADDGLTLEQIVMVQGYDDTVLVTLQGDHKAFFQTEQNGPLINLTALSIPRDLYSQGTFLLTLEATKPRTVGANTAISISLPAETQLEFEQQNYEGIIEDNILQLTQLILTQGYDKDPVSVHIENGTDHTSYFTATIQDNRRIIISMSPLPAEVIQLNTFVNLQVVALTEWSSASTIVTLEIIKDDTITPVFENGLYEGTYDPLYGLTLNEIMLVQGYDDTVRVNLRGDHASYFETVQEGRYINLSVSSLPETLFSERTVLLSIEATKPRTVGANAAISISLPADREMRFAAEIYTGTVRDNNLTLESIELSVGYTDNVTFTLSGDYVSYFDISYDQNQISLALREQLSNEITTENNFLAFTLTASAPNAITTSTTIILEIVQEDTNTPRFNQDIFFGTYTDNNLEVGPINLTQGYDGTVLFRLDGEFAQYFGISNANGNNIIITVPSPIPREVIFDEKVLTFSVIAEKELTVGAVAAVSIKFSTELTHPTALRFSKNIYVGSLDGNTVGLEDVILEHGLTASTEFKINGDYSSYFTYKRTENGVSISITNTLPSDVLDHKYITLELEARDLRAVPVTTAIIIDVTQPDLITPPVFNEAYYRGVYTVETDLQFEEEIYLSEGFDETVNFTLAGEFSQWFDVSQTDNLVTIITTSRLPEEILENHNNLLFTIVATKLENTTGRSVISIDLPKEVPAPLVISFSQASYVGQIVEGSLDLPPVTLIGGYDMAIHLNATGEFASYFTLSRESNVVSISMNSSLPSGVVEENAFILLDIEASYPEAVNGYTTVVFELVKEFSTQIVTPVFEQAYYTGQYTREAGLLFEQTIQLIQGYDKNISITLVGDDAEAFKLVENDTNNFTLSLKEGVIENLNNRHQLVFSVVASKPESLPGQAAIIITLADLSPARSLRFAQDYYTGLINNGNLILSQIVLEEGYSVHMQYSLRGDYNDYFQVTQQEGIFTVQLLNESTLPVEIINNTSVIILTLEVQLENSRAHTSIILNLLQDDPIPLQFDSTYYVGTYTVSGGLNFNNLITLENGYDDTVQLSLEGDLAEYFTATAQGPAVSIVLRQPIPQESIPSNGVILLELQASAPPALPAVATIVLEVVRDDDAPIPPVFAETFYVGSYSANGSFVFDSEITLAQGYDSTVTFELVGEQSQWFDIFPSGNSVRLTLSSAIPGAVLAKNQQLIFAITAQRPGSTNASATIIVQLNDEITVDEVLGFDRVNYVGSLVENTVDLGPIILSGESSSAVILSLHGNLAEYFTATAQGPAVSIDLRQPIPQESIPSNGVILLELQASAPPALPAVATIVLEVVRDDDAPIPPVFAETFYVGSYSANGSFVFDSEITLAQGYDSTVTFELVGEQSQWFDIFPSGNSVRLTLSSAIPGAVLANNQQLIFAITAQRPGSTNASATIIVQLNDEITVDEVLGFDRVNYVGSLVENTVDLGPIILSGESSSAVTLSLHGNLAEYFTATAQGPAVSIVLRQPIPQESIPSNGVILLELQASAPPALPAVATIVLEVVRDDDALIPPVFAETFYVGSYSANGSFVFDSEITLAQGYYSTVAFELVGEQSQWFDIFPSGNSVRLTLSSAIPGAVLANNQQLIFAITAQRPGSTNTSATIIVQLNDEITVDEVLGFDRVNYVGSLVENTVDLGPIILSGESSSAVTLSLHGNLAEYFTATAQGPAVSIVLRQPIPQESIPSNGVILLELQASAPPALPAVATIVLEVVRDDDAPIPPVFAETFYVGSYSANGSFVFDSEITLAQGYDSTVTFELVGEQSQWFDIFPSGNSVRLTLSSAIPGAVLANNQQLIFAITAQRPGSTNASATIIVQLNDEITVDEVLGFDRVNYVGSLVENTVDLGPIILSGESSSAVTISLHGNLAEYFTATAQGPAVSIVLRQPIPQESIPSNGVILLELQASAPPALPAVATIVLEIVRDDDAPIPPVFAETFYVGSYSANGSFVFDSEITLAQGYDSTVTFELVGEQSQWFDIFPSGNSVRLTLSSAIPGAVLANNQQLIFAITAQRPGSTNASATIIVQLNDEITVDEVLGFDRVNYVGSLVENTVDLGPIILSGESSSAVTLSLHGNLAEYFTATAQGPAVSIVLRQPIPQESIPSNGVILLELQASAPPALPAVATIVLEVVRDDDALIPPVFAETFYVGSYSANGSFVFDSEITLAQGYDSTVTFELVGEQSQWFDIFPSGNSVRLTLSSAIPGAVLANNQQLIFAITAQRPGSTNASATIIVQLNDEITVDEVLGFDRVNYVGSLVENTVDLGPIILSGESSSAVTLSLHGNLAEYFTATAQGPAVSIVLRQPIPQESIPSNGVILLELQASAPPALPAVATIVLEIVRDDDAPIPPVFAETFYVGSYSANGSFVFDSEITLAQGYDSTVTFELVGEQSQWFDIFPSGNSVRLTLSSAIPGAVLAYNQQLIFAITAQRPGSTNASATIIVQLNDEITVDKVLGFDRVNYVGSLVENTVDLGPIILSGESSSAVTLNLHGNLAEYFTATAQGPAISIVLRQPIPQESIPSNGVILLELQASAPPALPAVATIVLEIVRDDDAPIPPVFAETFYVGSYSANGSFVFDSEITLAQGYDSTVTFELVGEQSQWFDIFPSGNSVRLTLSSAIPGAVLANNQQLIFAITAQRPGSTNASATIIVQLNDEITVDKVLGFDRVNYVGSLVENTVDLGPIILSGESSSAVTLNLHGNLAEYFTATAQGPAVSIVLRQPIPQESIPSNGVILLELQASAPPALPAVATIVLEVVRDDDAPIPPVFAETFYVGSYSANGSFVFDSEITLAQGYDSTVTFELVGEQSQWFDIFPSGNSVRLTLSSAIPGAVLANNQQLIFAITAQRPGSTNASATIIVQLNDEITVDEVLGFDRVNYVGSLVENTVDLGPIILSGESSSAVTLSLHGNLAEYFTATAQGPAVSIVLRQPIPQESIPSNGVILLELQASAPPALPAVATIVLEVVRDDDALIPPVFAETFYVGSYSANGSFVFDSEITLAQGYDSTVTFELVGEQSQWFDIFPSGNSVRLTLSSAIPGAVLANNQQLIFAITAQRPGSTNASATIIVQLNDEITVDEVLGFDRVNYVGSLVENTVDLGPIILSGESSSAVTLSLHGNLAEYFTATAQGPAVSIVLRQPIPQESIPSNGVILLELQASAPPALPAVATIMLEVVRDDDVPIPLVFAETFYVGSYSANGSFVFDSEITLAQGYDSTVTFELVGEQSQWFDIFPSGNSVRLTLSSAIPGAVLANNQQLIFAITAQRPGNMTVRATIIVQLIDDDSSVIFDKVLYEGIIQSGVVQHATITVSGYEGTDIELAGVYASMFRASLSNGIVVVEAAGSLTLPADLNHLALELRVENAGAVLILQILATDGPVLPTVSFDSGSYALRVELGQTGAVGQVRATADNGEDVTYTLDVDNEHLRSRISINNAGELRLSAPANSGTYSFQAVATTVFSQARGSSTIHFLVDTLTVEKTAGNPLIVLDRNEEEPLRDLVTLNAVEHAGCRYTMTNKWPANQNWLYVDETGLHATAIDREDPSIAFMALSQIKVELTLSCEDDRARTKRSTGERLDWLGPHDYGTNTWLLGETITFNPRKSIVNLIVNDINDNAPIFVGVENQPIIVGYPISELEKTVLPRSLAELQATDADIGENAALVYWSSEPELAVSPTTGFVHVRNDQRLEENKILTVNATDLNGNGHTGSITLMVKLLDSSNIAVITVRGAFLEDERHVLGNLSNTIGYEVKALRSIVVSEAEEEPVSRMKRDIATEGASLEIYVYGLIQREPVAVETMITDINNAAVVPVNIANIQSLQDYIDGRLICEDPGRDTGLLVATIVLSVLLLILIVAIIVWFVLKRIRKPNYEEFSDTTSSVSQNDALGQTPKPLDSVAVAKPRLNIEELKRSERRLQDMLNAPINDVVVEPSTSNANNELNSVTKIPLPDPMAPIVIQDKLKDAVEESDDDEFGERKKARRKSVVTFNENVEKIIHVDEEPDVIADPNYEVYKL